MKLSFFFGLFNGNSFWIKEKEKEKRIKQFDQSYVMFYQKNFITIFAHK